MSRLPLKIPSTTSGVAAKSSRQSSCCTTWSGWKPTTIMNSSIVRTQRSKSLVPKSPCGVPQMGGRQSSCDVPSTGDRPNLNLCSRVGSQKSAVGPRCSECTNFSKQGTNSYFNRLTCKDCGHTTTEPVVPKPHRIRMNAVT